MSVSKITGAKNILFGGEGLFNTTVLGPGRVFVQTMPIYKLQWRLAVIYLNRLILIITEY